MPLTNAPESSPENFLARSTASFKTTLGGVSDDRSSCIARRRIARSMAARRSNRQFSACFRSELLGEVHGFVQDDFRRRIGRSELVHSEAQDSAIDGGKALESPVLRVLHDDFVQHGNFFGSALEQAVGKLARNVSGFRAAPEFCFQLGGLLMAHVPLEEHLHGKLARFGAERHATCPASLGTQDLFLMCWFPRSRS